MTRREYSEETKAAAIADLLSGEQPAVVAKRHGLNVATVRSWKNRLGTTSTSNVATDHATVFENRAMVQRPSIEDYQRRVGELVYRNLIAKLEASEHLSRFTNDDAWCAKQSAADIADLGTWLDGTARTTMDLLLRVRPQFE